MRCLRRVYDILQHLCVVESDVATTAVSILLANDGNHEDI